MTYVVFLGKTLPLFEFTQVYEWVPANLMLGVTLRTTSIPSREVRNIPSYFMPQNCDKLVGHFYGFNADFTILLYDYFWP